MDQGIKLAKVFFWTIVGLVVGILGAELGGYTFQRHVSTFAIRGTAEGEAMHIIAGFAKGFHPLTYFGSMFGAMYGCWRAKTESGFAILFAMIGAIIGFATSAYVMASPGPNYHTSVYQVPIGVFVGSTIGVSYELLRRDRESTNESSE